MLISFLFLAAAARADSYYENLNTELKAHGVAKAVVIIDLDRLDRNIDVLRSHLRGGMKFRATEKSLPSIGLLKYVMERTGSHRVMAFHYPFLKTMLAELPADTDFLFGKTTLPSGAREAMESIDEGSRADAAKRVHWLIDNKKTLEQYIETFRGMGTSFNANVEIDVGLHRGGARNPEEAEEILAAIRAHSSTVRFTGLMGYDGHVVNFPVPKLLKKASIDLTMADCKKKYRAFTDRLRARFPEEMGAAGVTLNGAGSYTYTLYNPEDPINDLSVGSALLKSKDFDLYTLKEHVPALFVAAPVLKRVPHGELAFIAHLQDVVNGLLRPRFEGFYLFGGGWGNVAEWPAGLRSPAITNDGGHNMVPNQSFFNGIPPKGYDVGDFAIFRPDQTDVIFQFEEIQLVRGGKFAGTWKPFSRRL